MNTRVRGSALAGKVQQEITPEVAYNLSLIDAGGNYWTAEDKKRIYFNQVRIGVEFVTGYFDCIARSWHVVSGSMSSEEFGAAVANKIAAGIKF